MPRTAFRRYVTSVMGGALVGLCALSSCDGETETCGACTAPDGGGASSAGGQASGGADAGHSTGGGGAGGEGGFSVPALLDDDSEVTIDSPADVPARRKALIEFLWGPSGLPSEKLPDTVEKSVPNPIASIPIPNLARVDRLVIEMDSGVYNEAFHFVPQNANGRLVIVHEGHDYTLDGHGLAETIAALVARGYGVLGAFMPCYSSLACPGIPQHQSSPHNLLIGQVEPAEGNVLKYFVEHLVVSLNYLQTQSETEGFAPYHGFAMTGLSGGGWTTVLYAAIDTRIQHSFPCSGSKPMYLRHCDGAPPACLDGYSGDAEQKHFPLYKHVAGYLDLYAMGGAGEGRKQVQVQIRKDSCCFGQNSYGGTQSVPGLTWNQAVRAYEQKIQTFLWGGGSPDRGSYRFEIDETAAGSHVISPTTLAQVILGELDGDRRPLAAATADQVYMTGPFVHLWTGRPHWIDTAFPAVGTPAVVASTAGADILHRDPSSALIHLRSGDPWTMEAWPGVIASDPAAVRTGDQLDVVAVGPDAKLSHWSKGGSGVVIQNVADPTTPVVGPAVLLASAAGLDVLVRRIDGGVQHVYRHGGSWATERVTNSVFRGFPTGVLTPDDTLHMFARGEDGALMEAVKPLGGGAWVLTSVAEQAGVPGTAMVGSPSAMLDPSSNDIVVVHRSPSGDLGQFTLAGTDAAGWVYQAISRPAGAPPSLGTASLLHSPVAVPGGAFALAQEGGVWLYAGQAGWSWIGSML